jgi:hypothetical protein
MRSFAAKNNGPGIARSVLNKKTLRDLRGVIEMEVHHEEHEGHEAALFKTGGRGRPPSISRHAFSGNQSEV